MNIIALPPLLLTFIVAFVSVYVFSQNIKHPVNRVFLAFSLITTLYTFADYHYLLTSITETAVFWMKVQMIWPLIYIVQFHFLILLARYPVKIPRNWMFVLYFLGIWVASYFMIRIDTGAIERSGNIWVRSSQASDLTGQLILMGFTLPLTIITLIFGIRHIIKSRGRKKIQIFLILSGMMLPAIYAIIKESSPQTSALLSVPISYVSFISWLFFVYAIWRYRLFNITPGFASQNIISTMKEGLVLLNEEENIIDSNEAFCEMFGLKKNEISNLPFERVLNKDTFLKTSSESGFANWEISNKQFEHTNPQGQKLTLNMSGSVIQNYIGGKAGFVLVITDFTEFENARKKEREQQQQMANMAHQAGMAEIASNIMHNIGNVLNSIHVSSEHISSILNRSKIKELAQINQLLKINKEALARFLSTDSKGKIIPEYFKQVAETLEHDYRELKKESERLEQKISLIGESIELQQGETKPGNFYELVTIAGLLEEVFKILQTSFSKHGITVSVKYSIEESQVIEIPKNRMFNVLLNIIKNAYESVRENDVDNRLININISSPQPENIQFDISDNGSGIAPENQDKLFNFGFTTKERGNGFGLHYCANTIHEMGGSISAKSDGLNKGALFSISIPVKQSK
jgi:PAS domain S-box-containing protein